VIKVHAVLRAALSDAERMDLVARNVAKAAKPPSLSRSERRALTSEEAQALLAALVNDRLESLFVLALTTGLRRAELLGLRWSDVDLPGRVLFVRHASTHRPRGSLSFPQRLTALRLRSAHSRGSDPVRPPNGSPPASCGPT
jgi:integrase